MVVPEVEKNVPVKMDVEIADTGKLKNAPDQLTLADIRNQINMIDKTVFHKDPSYMGRALRMLPSTRRRLNSQILGHLIKRYMMSSGDGKVKVELTNYFGETAKAAPVRSRSPSPTSRDKPTDTPASGRVRRSKPASAVHGERSLVEVECYIHMLALVYLIDHNQLKKAVSCAESLMRRIVAENRRTLDRLASRCYFYYSRAFELQGRLAEIRPFLVERHRTCVLRNDADGTAALINLLLRNYLHYNLYDQAQKLLVHASFPDEHVANSELARFYFYKGRISAVQLNYSAAHDDLQTALRKAGQSKNSLGFRQTVHKLAVVVELLLGDIPDRSVFLQEDLRRSLLPYFWISQAVRSGDLERFNALLLECRDQFVRDHTFLLIVRLRHNVIKTGVRKINASYSRIYLKDIAAKLHLGNEDAEYICSKAIRDGVIQAHINHEEGYLESTKVHDAYSSTDPAAEFDSRIRFCLDLHNRSLRAMRYADKRYNDDLESAEERREREQMEFESARDLDDEYDFHDDVV